MFLSQGVFLKTFSFCYSQRIMCALTETDFHKKFNLSFQFKFKYSIIASSNTRIIQSHNKCLTLLNIVPNRSINNQFMGLTSNVKSRWPFSFINKQTNSLT